MRNTPEGRKMIGRAMSAPYLERDEEQNLALAWKECGDQQAMNRIVTAHMRMVIAMAGKFRFYGLSMADLVQEGHVGLLEAAARFEPERGLRFSTYAAWWIRAAMQDHVLRNWSIVRGGTSSAQKSLFFNLRRLRTRISQAGTTDPSAIHSQIAGILGVSVADVAVMDMRLSRADVALDAPLGDDGDGPGRMDYLVSDAAGPDRLAEDAIDGERRSQALHSAFSVLTSREMQVIRARRLAEDGATLEELGHRLGVSKERVRQIEVRALEKLKGVLTGSGQGL
ncbi:MAG: RNA polymerase factor sigma-32 [Rhizobiaceae bacterium]